MVSLICTLQHHTDDVNWCALSRNLLATCSTDKTVRIFSIFDFSELPFSPLIGHGYGVHCCCFSACGQYLASCSTDGCTIIWSMGTGERVAVFAHPGRCPVRVCTFSSDSAYLLSGGSDGTFSLWDFRSRALLRTGSVNEATVGACSFSPCGQMFVTGTSYGDVRGEVVRVRLASCGQDSQLKIWSISRLAAAGCRMQLLHTLTGQSGPVLSCAFSPDGQQLISGYVTACAFAPTTSLIATGSMDKTVNVWRVGDGLHAGGDEGEAVPGRKLQQQGPGHSRRPVSEWSEGDVSAWLQGEGLGALVRPFSDNNIDGAELLNLTKDSLTTELNIDSVGLRNKLMRKIDGLKTASAWSNDPDEFLCPITREVMSDPVIAADGYSYEREAIQSWINSKNRSSPMTNLPLQTTMLTPNRTLKMAIGRWKSSQ
ncbi:hypothetical protein JZ751_027674 [Albula glossodonta]|uniref:WD repeat, SAM and U-box domain-containing protein 1 n=1 Tax=Albula glossodonta TaxID=121402 RepID=A0A8T2PDH0_9TELE|nr:hypothetical protein JZ751_027674 [Albula glossodonta]